MCYCFPICLCRPTDSAVQVSIITSPLSQSLFICPLSSETSSGAVQLATKRITFAATFVFPKCIGRLSPFREAINFAPHNVAPIFLSLSCSLSLSPGLRMAVSNTLLSNKRMLIVQEHAPLTPLPIQSPAICIKMPNLFLYTQKKHEYQDKQIIFCPVAMTTLINFPFDSI